MIDLLDRIHIDHIFYIAPAQLHGTAVEDLRDALGIKPGKHHFASTGIVGDSPYFFFCVTCILTDLRSKANQYHPLQRKRS